MDLFYRFFFCNIVLKVFLSPMRFIISSSIIYGTTWTTVKIQLQKMGTCHAINNIGCMHIFALPLRFLQYGKLRTFSLLQGSQMGFWLTIILLCTWLYVTFLRSGNCQFWMLGVLSKSFHNVKMSGPNPFHIGSFATLMLELCMS
jgi:hypothetical protein